MTWSNAIDYTFNTILHGQSMAWGAEAAYKALLDYGADKTRVSLEWVRHHYQLIVWKAACIYRSYPEEHGVWSVNWILKQLRYRYEREINKRETPAIRMILEEFELPLLPLVLCVIDMPQRGILRLTDGWYILNAQLDKPLEDLYIKEQLKPGDKIVIGSIQIIGHPNEIAALTSNPVAIIALSINSVRRARWDTRLGFVRHSIPMTCISSINPAGGMISAVDVVAIRKLPRLLMETESNGRKLFTPLHLLQSHNEETWLLDHPNLAHICEPAFESSRSLDEMAEQQASTLWTTLMQMDCMIEYCDNQASNTMKNLAIYLQQYPDKHKQLLVKIKEQIQSDRQRQRRVVLFRVLVRDVTMDADDSITDLTSGVACITIWSPPEQLYDEIQLGKRYQILHLSPSSTSNGQYQHASTRYDGVLQLQANRRSHWRERSLPMDSEHINDWLPTVKCLSSLSNYTSYKTEWSDIVFVVLCTSHKITKQQRNHNTTTPLVIIGDDSNRMALLHLEPNTIRLNSFKDGHVYTLCNLQSIDYDARFKMPVIRTSENSELFGQHHTPSYARSKLQQLLQWKQQRVSYY
ncbi:BRCA2, oligonucleotide/oligosaccharide-binding, domain 1-domain-containing protein [Syncephalis plumigaleata]|nr:BRCA2, oligonucleotide/oligosaccharide-binding, domain 1-domain-containing protein [Syncephalis plumigaleata]